MSIFLLFNLCFSLGTLYLSLLRQICTKTTSDKKKESKCHFLDYITTLPTSTETTARFNKIKNKNQT